jgi:hypothetical protein
MNDIIIMGFADERGESKPRLVSGLEVESADQIDVLDRAKRLHRFPEGVKSLKQYAVTEIDCAVFISDSVGDAIEKAEKEKAAAAVKNAVETKAKAADAGKIEAARLKVQTLARSRNELMGKLHQAEVKLRNHEETPELLRGKLHDGSVRELQGLILGNPEKKIDGLKGHVDDAVAAYDKAVKELDELAKPPVLEKK